MTVGTHSEPNRHPWLADLVASPIDAVADLMAGYADIFPFTRADAPDAARMLTDHLHPDDPARDALAKGVLGWLRAKRSEPLPLDPARLQDFVRQVSEVFEIISLLRLIVPAVTLRKQYVRWLEWANRLVLVPSRDAQASYFRMLASTQPAVCKHVTDPGCTCAFLDARLSRCWLVLSQIILANRIVRTAEAAWRNRPRRKPLDRWACDMGKGAKAIRQGIFEGMATIEAASSCLT